MSQPRAHETAASAEHPRQVANQPERISPSLVVFMVDELFVGSSNQP